MTWWMILLLIFAILFLIGCIPVGAAVDYQDEALAVRAKIGPFGIQILPKREKKAKKSAKSTQKNDKKASAEAKKSEKKPSAFLSGDVGALFDLLRLVCDTLGNLRRKIRVELLVLHVTYGGDDPAQAAINYGRSWAVIGALNPYLERLFVIKKRDIRPILDYNTDKLQINAHLTVTITIGRVLALALRAGVGFLKIMKETKKAVQ